MKKLIYLVLIGLSILACKEEPKTSYTIDGTAEGVFNGMRVYLSKVNERGAPIPKDTAIVMNEKFSFKGSVDYPQFYYVTLNGTPGRLSIILENGDLNLNLDNKIIGNSKLTGSESNDVNREFRDKMAKLTKDREAARVNLQQSVFLKDSAKIKSDREIYQKIVKEFTEYPNQFLKENNNNYGILPIYNEMINQRNPDMEILEDIYTNMDSTMKNTEDVKRIRATLDKMKIVIEASKATAIGAKAPEFSAPSPTGEPIALSDVVAKGKVTIIDFWAAWCGPCRRENPNVVRIYDKYHVKGLEIIGVGLDGRRGQQNPKEAWTKAIEQDKLTWHQVSNLNYFGEIARDYNIRSIPSMFVLDNEGTIIAKNLRGAALENKISELLD